jgi:hypothetical protein
MNPLYYTISYAMFTKVFANLLIYYFKMCYYANLWLIYFYSWNFVYEFVKYKEHLIQEIHVLCEVRKNIVLLYKMNM